MRLSSIITHFYKGIPLLLLSVGLYWLTSDFRSVKLEGIVSLCLMSAVWHLLTFRWKSVHLQGDVLSVSTFLRRGEIPLANVESVSASSWWGWQPRTVTVTLKSPSEFGERIVFVPRDAGMRADRTASELRGLISDRS